MMYQHLFFDIDNTLLDFDAAEDQALNQLFEAQEVVLTDNLKTQYQDFNRQLWCQYEQGTLKRETLLQTRFAQFFETYLHKTVNGPELSTTYLQNLARGHVLMPQAQMLLRKLATPDHHLYITTNGVASTQYRRLEDSALAGYFEKIFVSEELGYQKPDPFFFKTVFEAIPNFNPKEAVIIGDSLTSDIQGGLNVNVDTIWYNPTKQMIKASDPQPTHEVYELMTILSL
jgi:2-haloacid dehalogenase